MVRRTTTPQSSDAAGIGIIPSIAPAPDSWQIMRMIENGDESQKIFIAITEYAIRLEGVEGVAIFLPSDKGNAQQEIVVRSGKIDFDALPENEAGKNSHQSLPSFTSGARSVEGDLYYFGIVCVGAHIGSLVVLAPQGMNTETAKELSSLAHHCSVAFERQKLGTTLQHYLDRLQVLNELNQLIATNVGLQRIVKSLARESAFRFAADIALTFLINESVNELEVKGGYGCAPAMIPHSFSLEQGFLSQVMRLGGHLSISNLTAHEETGLEFLLSLGVRSIDACCLEVKGEMLGAILIAHRRETALSPNDLVRFEEFCQGAGVAIANARSQERIHSYTERLEELVEQRTADLAVQSNRAEEANRAKSQFLANMSHELRTPLTAIMGYGSVLADGVFGPMTDKQRDALHAITRSSEHLKNLIDDVLNLARIESGKEVPEPTRVSVRDLLQQATKLMQQTALSKGIAILPCEAIDTVLNATTFCDKKHIHQIIINLMSNAVKYTPKGGKVWVKAELVSDKVKIMVTDTGVGIPPDKLAKLFERFERGEDAYSKSQEGTGIGLNLTKHLVELNGGRIGVESTVGQGSTFWILMPLAGEQHTAITQIEHSDATIRLDGLSTVVIDDNPDTCNVLMHILKAAGATVEIAHSVKEGLRLISTHAPDVILTDLAIPGESGLALIEHVRNSAQHGTTTPIIVLSACAFESDRRASLDAGASLFMAKPFKPTEVIQNIRQLAFNNALQQ